MAPSTLFLGIELAVDQLRASLVDESLDLVGVECVDFDTELAEYQTQGGIFTTPGEAYTTPVEMWIKALGRTWPDLLFEKLERAYDLTRIKSIGGSAQHALVWWKSTTVPSLSSLDPHTPLAVHFSAAHFSLPNTPVAQDVSSSAHALAIEALVGGPDHLAARVGAPAAPSSPAAQLLRVRETWPADVWARTGRVQLASSFLASLVAGKWMPLSEPEAAASGLWAHATSSWDEGVLDVVGGSREEGRRVRGWLGEVDVGGGARRTGTIGRYLVERYGFDPDTGVTPFTSDSLAAYLSLAPQPADAVLQFGPTDTLLVPAGNQWRPTRLYALLPHPAQDLAGGEKRRYVAQLTSRNADVPRALVRDMYTKSWSAFDRLVAIVPPGGSIGLDDKLFAFWHLQPDAHPFAHVKGIYRFETGIKVAEFRDLRANPRCLLESQILGLRVKYARMVATGVLARSASSPSNIGVNQVGGVGGGVVHTNPGMTQTQAAASAALSSIPTRAAHARPPPPVSAALGLAFDPYDTAPLPTRIVALGAAANFPSVANLVGDVFNAPVFVPHTQLASAREGGAPQRNAPAPGCVSRASLGGAYIARWVWGREWAASTGAAPTTLGFEEDIRRLLAKRWATTGGAPLRASLHPSAAQGSGSGTSTPYGRRAPTRAANALLEEEEDEEREREARGYAPPVPHVYNSGGGGSGRGSPGVIGPYVGSTGYEPGGGMTPSSSSSSMASVAGSVSTAYTTPDMGLLSPSLGQTASGGSSGLLSPGGSGLIGSNGTAGTPTTPTPLTPVAPLPTGDAEAQVGLAKVAEPDADAFMAYAAIVPEYCRLEGMLVKGIV
ncbi:D-xylulose kinase [Mycena polygramma]|nr:D-xylulose kinase [Mycena polygramma]